MHRSERHAAVVAAFAALFFGGMLLTVFGGAGSLPVVPERVVVLGQSGHIIRAQVGDVIDIQLGDVTAGSGAWRFSSSAANVQVTPVYAASMPQVCPAGGGTGRETAGLNGGVVYAADGGTMPGASSDCTPRPAVVRLVRLTMIAPGVSTVKGWRVQPGSSGQPAAADPQGLPDFVFILLVKS